MTSKSGVPHDIRPSTEQLVLSTSLSARVVSSENWAFPISTSRSRILTPSSFVQLMLDHDLYSLNFHEEAYHANP